MALVAICSFLSLSPSPSLLESMKTALCIIKNQLPGKEGNQEGRTIHSLPLFGSATTIPRTQKLAIQTRFTDITSLEEPDKDLKWQELCLVEKNMSLNFVFIVSEKRLWFLIGRAVWSWASIYLPPFPSVCQFYYRHLYSHLLNHIMVFPVLMQ